MNIVFTPALAILFLLVCCIGAADSKKAKAEGKLNGLHQYHYPDGQLYMEVNFKDSIPHGITKQYFKNGQVFDETNYNEGIRHGISRKYYEDGKLSQETPYDSGKIHGIQKKFRKDGTPAFEAPYYFDNACVGLKEYYLNGTLVEKYPKIVITTEDRLWKEFKYVVRIALSEKAKVEFYRGELTDGKYIGAKASRLYLENNGTSFIEYYVHPGQFVMEKVNIIAKVKTDLGNYFITQKSINVAVENR
jgi:hypothetical protein